jgi:hypothetical protein
MGSQSPPNVSVLLSEQRPRFESCGPGSVCKIAVSNELRVIRSVTCCLNPNHIVAYYKRSDLLSIVSSKDITECLGISVKSLDHFDLVRDVLSSLIDIVQDFKDRALYDLFSMNLLKCNVFPPVVNYIA